MKNTAKRFIIVLLSLLLSIGTGHPLFSSRGHPKPYGFYPTSAYAAEMQYYLTTGRVNQRSGPGISYPILQKIPAGTAVPVSGISNSWAKVYYKGQTGYSHTSYLKSSTPYITTGRVNLRSGPGISYPILRKIPAESTVAVFTLYSKWAKLVYDGTVGYSSLSYLKAAPSEPPEEPDPPEEPPPPETINKIYKGVTAYSGKRLAITFDDRIQHDRLDDLLDLLDRYDAKCTFFFTGNWVAAYPEDAKELIRRGHTLESHTYHHVDLPTLSDAEILAELTTSGALIKKTVGVPTLLIRPPFGKTDERVERIARQAGYDYMVLWNIHAGEYSETSTAETVAQKAIDGAANNAIMLLHPALDKVMQALPTILETLDKEGYVFTTVNDMLP